MARVLELFETRYPDFTAKHFWEKLVAEHDFKRSYNWVRLTLQGHGLIKPAPWRGAHRRKRSRRPMVGMMLHQDASSHEWVAGAFWDLVVTMDDAMSEIYSAFFVAEEGTMSSFRGLREVIAEHGLFCELYVDRAGQLEDILCVQHERVVSNDNTVRYKNRTLQIPADRHRHHYVKARLRVHEYPRRQARPVPRPTAFGLLHSQRTTDRTARPKGRVIRFDARPACG